MYKVFINGKLIKLTNDYSDYLSDEHALFLKYVSNDALAMSIELLVKNKRMNQLVVFNDDLDELWTVFKSHYQLIKAGGGLVQNKQNQFLFIYKRGKWDLPKGKSNDGEELEATALREVEEECGVSGLKVVKPIATTHHIFKENDEAVLKQTNWYAMTTDFDGELKVDKKEGIEKAAWLEEKEVKELLDQTYPSIAEVFSEAKSV